MKQAAFFLQALIVVLLAACGTAPASLVEFWDRGDVDASANMQMQIKRAIFCELRAGALRARKDLSVDLSYRGKRVTSVEDIPLPDSWGALVTLTISADEKSTLSPGVTFTTPLEAGRAAGQAVGQSFAFGLGGTASSQNIRSDKTDFYYTVGDLVRGANSSDICGNPPSRVILGPPSKSSPLVDGKNLDIQDWIYGAAQVTGFQRSSRAAADGQGPPLHEGADSATYSNKFVIVTGVNATPVWNLVRVSTSNSALIDLNRTRTHELIITLGPGAAALRQYGRAAPPLGQSFGPSQSAVNSHLASQIGSAVANAIRSQ